MFSKLSNKVRIYTCFITVILLGGCHQQLQPNLQQQRSKQVMAVSAHPLASAAGLSVLQQGGNAVDAAAATALAISVVEPFSAGIGGGGFLLLRRAETGTVQALDFRERSPKRATRDMYLDKQGKVRPRASLDGHLAAGIPGTVAGLYTVHREYGKLPWAQVVAPAIALAQKGFPVSSRFTKATLQRKDAINKNRAARDIFTRGDVLYQPGEVLVQRDLARTLRQIAQNPQSFYRGDIARAIATDMAKNGGIITLEDLKNYTPIWRNPVCGKFRTYEICAMSPPSSGGVHLLQILNILGDTDLKSLGRKSPDALHLLAESMRIAYADRAEYLGDPDFVSVPVKALTNKNYGKFRRSQIEISKAKPSSEVKAVDAKTLSRFVYESPETTHLTVVDKERNVVSLTFTVNGGFGAGVVAAGTGILLNNEMDDFAAAPGVPNLFGLVGGEANAIAPLKTPLSSMTPVIVTENGQFRLAAGAPGGSTIITTVLQIVLNLLVYDMNVGEAVSAPRVHHQWQPDRLMVERGGFEAGTLEELRRRGHQIVERDGWGNANAIVLTDDGWLEGAADPRGEGEARGF
ncbi:MAG: gamma-glutamyltransferase [Oscillatoriales cyanobacterium]|uniref:gamma-glutamyltransferase n=1 Tax=Microcoleus sp. PH2017_05_CCC_O_A TaxID=2798816 RepID=UPI001D7A2CFE|nr:gamma-glutamyltransferase [Microcoleus sp. PH2017_05_CCC_O_A]TAF95159.1 MAG: gamma-glutamyltransferase [Oscillatoriales cyanobacterium]MCC3439629.1 gamma-glutamyltransferase [Microcoleus sp. PH2017_05_CCC_O_A]TAG19371.1 MAG: gamma-glutamyltransferase [Oscillatoriales cyanobacterium]TAG38164.1 MAG: gamma-glutamyltransferase [Oscillatoriales cyanobacterium]TAG63266.1 MAG: gamma-glutamyltransferase [Oscillatoriales cyanobacterium]